MRARIRRIPAVQAVLVSTLILLLGTHGTQASAQTSRNMQLLAHMDLHSQYIGSWSYVHPDGREYVAVATSLGTSIVRLTDPSNPVEVAFITGPLNGIREVEPYQTYLYVVSRGANPSGIQVISMADPDHPVLVNTVNDITAAENVTIDAARGYLYTTETEPSTTHSGIHIFSLADPANPVRIGIYETSDFHDITVKGTRGYACSIPDGMVHILDLTNPATPVELASFTSALAYTHSAWPTEDDRYLIVADELLSATPTTLNGRPSVYDIQNLSQISLVYRFDDLPQSIVHFPFVRGNRAFFAYYTAGVRMWDISNPAQPAEVGFYDTWPGDDGIYSGAYECTPFYPSGIVTATDRSTGLYVLRPQSTYGIVRGFVRDAGGGMKPLAGVSIRALPDGPATLSAADGSFALGPSSGPSVTIEASAFGYLTQSTTLAISDGSDQTVNFSLSKSPTGNLKGTVRRASDQSIVAGADITLVGTPVAMVTNSMGKYSLSKIPVGSYTVRADYVGLVPSGAPINLETNPTLTVDFTLATPPFYDDAETDRGWTLGAPDDDAVAGRWIRAVPIGTTSGSFPAQPSEDHTPAPGTVCFVTGNAPAGSPNTQESVRGGKTTLISPPLDLSAIADPRIAYWLWFFNTHQAAGSLACTLTTELSNDDGLSWTTVSTFQAERVPWTREEIRVTDYFASPSAAVRLRIVVENRVTGVVEAALDDFEYYSGVGSGARVLEAAGRDPGTRSAGLRIRSLEPMLTRTGTSWAITLDRAQRVRADVFNVQGQLVRTIFDGSLPAGSSTIRWDGRLASGGPGASGVYWVRVSGEDARRNLRVVIAR